MRDIKKSYVKKLASFFCFVFSFFFSFLFLAFCLFFLLQLRWLSWGNRLILYSHIRLSGTSLFASTFLCQELMHFWRRDFFGKVNDFINTHHDQPKQRDDISIYIYVSVAVAVKIFNGQHLTFIIHLLKEV